MEQDNNRALAVLPEQGLSPAEVRRYQKLKRQIGAWWEERLKIGEVLREIRDARLYREEYPSFEAFCESEYGIKSSQAYRLIEAAGVKASVAMSPIGEKLVRESQARALASVPAENRVAVLTQAAETGNVTARGLTEAAQSINGYGTSESQQESPATNLDRTAHPIPESVLEDWRRAEAQRGLLTQISQVRSRLKAALDNEDVIFAEVTNSTIADLDNAYGSLKCVIPYAVCTSCQGHQRKKCTLCRRRGFLSEFAWRSFVPAEIKAIREKAKAK